jgi:hypothetical protein
MKKKEFKVSDYIDFDFIKTLENINDPSEFIDECENHIGYVLSDVIGENKLLHEIPTDEERDEFETDVAFILTMEGSNLHDEYMSLFHSIAERKFPNDMNWFCISSGLID